MMKIPQTFLKLAIIFFLLVLFIPSGTAIADDTKSPAIGLSIFLSQGKIRINEPILGSISITNISETDVETAELTVLLPESVRLFHADCSNPFQLTGLMADGVKANSVKTWDVCYKLEKEKAQAGTFNLLYKLTYGWDGKSALVSMEKTIEIDLIGVQSVLGIPLAFAGFVLPGLMLLVALKMVKMPWAVNLATDDRIIYGIFISLLLLGPLTYLAGKPNSPGWLQIFNLNEQVSLERLISYVFTGMILGLVIGMFYLRQKKIQSDLAITIFDSNKAVMKKALKLNSRYSKGTMVFFNKKENYHIIGSHFVSTDTTYQVLPQFRLTLSNITDVDTRNRVNIFLHQAGNNNEEICKDPKNIQKIIEIIEYDSGYSVIISQPVSKLSAESQTKEFFRNLKFIEIKKEDFNATKVEDTEISLLDIVD
jgi:hypothetical protein